MNFTYEKDYIMRMIKEITTRNLKKIEEGKRDFRF